MRGHTRFATTPTSGSTLVTKRAAEVNLVDDDDELHDRIRAVADNDNYGGGLEMELLAPEDYLH